LSLIIHAPNIHRGGGKTLLLNLLQSVSSGGEPCLSLVDDRMELPRLSRNIEIIRFPPTIAGRVAAEKRLTARSTREDVVLCLGNLPPLSRPEAQKIVLFLHNRYLLDARTSGFSLAVRLRNAVERLWLRKCINNVDQVIVQSSSMAGMAHRCLGITPVIAPFSVSHPDTHDQKTATARARSPEPAFIYVASGEPHKNHHRLVEAWTILAAAGIHPLLRLTVNPAHHPALASWIDGQARQHGLRIENAGEVEPERLAAMYGEATALIYPSLTESLGLPLLEASAHGLPVIASERDFVRDIVVPQQTFDPESALSMARAVRRFMGLEDPVLAIRTPGEFLQMVMNEHAHVMSPAASGPGGR